MTRTNDRVYQKKRAALKKQRLPCWLCGEAIDYQAPPGHPMSFEADHVVSLQSGGSNRGELRPAHSRCNRRRGRREQVSLKRSQKQVVIPPDGVARWIR